MDTKDKTMTSSERAAFITAQTEMMKNEREILLAENTQRAIVGQSPANGPDEWEAWNKKWEPVLGYNALIAFLKDN